MSIASWRNRRELLWSGYYPGRDDAVLALKQQQQEEAELAQREQQFLVYFYILVLKNTAEQAHYAEKITT